MIFAFVCLTLFSMVIHPCCCKWHHFIIFYGWIIFHCISTPHFLYFFICQWTLRLYPCFGYCKQCCYECRGAYIFLNSNFQFFWIYTQESDHIAFLRNSIVFSINCFTASPIYILTNSVAEFSFLLTLPSVYY